MANELIRPFDEESAKAIQEAAKFLSKLVEAGAGVGHYLDRIFGRVPDNLVGYLGGDWLLEHRVRNAERLRAETEQIRRRRGTQETADISPSVAIPLVQAAIDEDREGLRELWAKLLANAMDPERTHLVRPTLINLLKKLDPLDARALQQMAEAPMGPPGDIADALSKRLGISRDEAFFSIEHLYELGCLDHSPSNFPFPRVSAKGRLLIQSVT